MTWDQRAKRLVLQMDVLDMDKKNAAETVGYREYNSLTDAHTEREQNAVPVVQC